LEEAELEEAELEEAEFVHALEEGAGVGCPLFSLLSPLLSLLSSLFSLLSSLAVPTLFSFS
jgi:hypothetical protein